MDVKKVLKTVTLALFLGLLIGATGCSKIVRITPISEKEFFPVYSGKSYVAPQDGWFVSNDVVNDIFQAKID